MNKKVMLCGIVSTMAAFSFVACEDDDDNNGGNQSNIKVEGSLVDTSDPVTSTFIEHDTLATYSFNMQKKEGTLQLLNVFLASCPNAKYSSSVDFKNDSIKITLSDDTPNDVVCGASLLRDFTYKFTGLDAKKYNISVFSEEGISISSFDLDLSKFDNGVILAEKKGGELKGSFLSHSSCKGSGFGLRSGEVSDIDDIDTVATYSFDLDTKTGIITYVNFNASCATNISSSVSIEDDEISISPYETPSYRITEQGDTIFIMADCMCTYDVTSQFTGIEAKEYTLKVIKYFKIYTFKIDLSKSTSGVLTEKEVDKITEIDSTDLTTAIY